MHDATALSWVPCLSTCSTPTQLSPALQNKASDSSGDLADVVGISQPCTKPPGSPMAAFCSLPPLSLAHVCQDCSLSTAKAFFAPLLILWLFSSCFPAAYAHPEPSPPPLMCCGCSSPSALLCCSQASHRGDPATWTHFPGDGCTWCCSSAGGYS